jgi:hypothetical protein
MVTAFDALRRFIGERMQGLFSSVLEVLLL